MHHPAALALTVLAVAACSAPPRPFLAEPSGAPASPAPGASPASAPCLSIVGWNDVHGRLDPSPVPIDTGAVPAGGVIALADGVAAVRATGDAVVVLDAGDLFTGPLESSLPEGAPIIQAWNAIGVDAAVIGNHEFDFGPVGYDRVIAKDAPPGAEGPEGPRGALLARLAEARFPFLSANVRRKDGTPVGWPNLAASTIVERGGYRVGVVGYTTGETPSTTLLPNVSDLEFTKDAAALVGAEIAKLRGAGAAPVVLLAHASLEGDLPQRLDDPADPAGKHRKGEIAALLDGLGGAKPDVIIAGHRHAWLLGRVRGVPIVSSDQHGVGFARLRFCRAAPSAAPALERIDRHVAMGARPPSSELGRTVEAAVRPYLDRVSVQAAEVVTTLPRACAAQALDGTALAEQMARAVAERVDAAATAPAGVPVVGLVNTGGLRAPLAAGPATFGDLYTTLPFENGVAVCGTTRAGLERVLANAFARPKARDRFPIGIAGATLEMERVDGAPRVRSLAIAGQKGKGKPDDPVWLALPDFVLWGGDGLLDGVACSPSTSSALRMRDAWRAVLAREAGGCDGAPKNVRVTRP
jgi:5'-nucleotidase